MAGTTLFILTALILTKDIYCALSILQSDEEDNGGYKIDPKSYPYQAYVVSVINDETIKCGGSIISEKYILTAASCVDRASSIKVRTGLTNTTESEEDNPYKQGSAKIHPNYVTIYGNDFNIALIELDEKLTLGENEQAISLVKSGTVISYNTFITVTGWSETYDNGTERSPVFKAIHLRQVPLVICRQNIEQSVTDYSFCTLPVMSDANVCQGDIGDPAFVLYEFQQIGVLASTSKQNCSNQPSVFANIGNNNIREWIQKEAGV